MEAQQILDFWFDDAIRPNWFKQDKELDEVIRVNFADVWRQASLSELVDWRDTMYGRLAEIIILDQFSRNLFRHDARAFAQDGMALVLAQTLVQDEEFNYMLPDYKHFALMPFMHSESRIIHEQGRKLFAKHTSAYALDFELRHKEVIDQFGRYPSRNALLGRKNTPEETKFLKEHKDGLF